jgi:hypothetical protein
MRAVGSGQEKKSFRTFLPPWGLCYETSKGHNVSCHVQAFRINSVV